MPARVGLGLAGALPADWERARVEAHLMEFTTKGISPEFFEVLDGQLCLVNSSQVRVLDSEKPWEHWHPDAWFKQYTAYPEWYQDAMSAWECSGARGDISYDQWSEFYVSVFVPIYEEEQRSVRFETLGTSLEVASCSSGYYLARDLDLPAYFRAALDRANEFQFLVRISG